MWLELSERYAHTRRRLDMDDPGFAFEVRAFVKDFYENQGVDGKGRGSFDVGTVHAELGGASYDHLGGRLLRRDLRPRVK
jgi:hypothetical protein